MEYEVFIRSQSRLQTTWLKFLNYKQAQENVCETGYPSMHDLCTDFCSTLNIEMRHPKYNHLELNISRNKSYTESIMS